MKTGDIINLRYKLIKQLQTAWLADDLSSGRPCLLRSAADFIDPPVAEWLGRIWHPGLPRLLESFSVDGADEIFVFEYRDGIPLSAKAAENEGKLSPVQLLPAMSQAAKIVAFLHQQGDYPILHLDIKPDHLLLDDEEKVCLIDFGAAVRLQAHPETAGSNPITRRALTPEYAAPEQLAGRPGISSDLYSLGLSMLQLLTGLPASACRSCPLPDLLIGIPDALHRVIGRCLQSDPAQRYSGADELAYELDRIIASHTLKESRIQLLPDLTTTSADDTVVEAQSANRQPAPLVCVWDCAEFGCEMASALGESKRVLVIDADLLNPRADLLLGLRITGEPGGMRQMGGLDLAIAEQQRGSLDITSLNRLVQPTRVTGVNALTTRNGLDQYEFYDLESLYHILRLTRLTNDLVIVLCSRFVFDAFTCLCLQAATRVVIPLPGDCGSFRERIRSLEYLSARQQIDSNKISFAAFPYNAVADLSKGTLDELSGGRFVGCISDSTRRRIMKSGALPYAADIDKTNLREYRSLAQRLQLADKMRKKVN